MEYDITNKRHTSNIENAESRSVYGDMHAHREALLNAEHVEFLRRHAMVDAVMLTELMKPVGKDRNYTEEYLRTHPAYTDSHLKMISLSAAERRQTMQDRKMEKFVKDYEAGKIDENGNTITFDMAHSGSESSALSESTDLDDHSDGADEIVKEPEDQSPVHSPGHRRDASSQTSPLASSGRPSRSTHAPMAISASGSSDRKRTYRVEPLQPLPGHEDYSQYRYYQLLAVCRERQIYSAGDTQGVRNCLIQDDINIHQGLPRDIARWKGHVRRDFKNDVPDALKRASERE